MDALAGPSPSTSSSLLVTGGGGGGKIDWTRYGKRYRSDWERLPECQGWLVRALGGDPSKARCRLCRKEMRAHLGDIKKHARSDMHKHVVKITAGGRVKVEGYNVGPKYTRVANTYCESWEDEPECEGWLVRSEYGAHCEACDQELMPKINELKKHGRSQKHLRNMTTLWDRQGFGGTVSTRTRHSYSTNEYKPKPWLIPDIKKHDFELKVALVSGVECGFRGSREVCAVLEERLGVDAFSMTGAEARELFATVLVPHFRQFLKEDMREAPFSLVLDNAGGITRSGEVGVAIHYFSRSQQRAVSTYLGLLRIDRQDIQVLVDSINALLAEWELQGANLVALLTDGVGEVCRDRQQLTTLLVPTCPNFLHLSSSFASLANAFDAAVKRALPPSVEFMLRESFNWFADSGERQHRHADVMEQVGFGRREEQQRAEEEEREAVRTHAEEVQVAQKRKRGRPPKMKGDIADDEAAMDVRELEDDEAIDDSVVLDDAVSDEAAGRLRRIRPDAQQWIAIADYTTGLFLHYDALKVHFERAAEGDAAAGINGCYMARLLNKEFCSEHNRLYFTVLQPMLTEMADLRQHLTAREAVAKAAADRPHDEEAVAAAAAAVSAAAGNGLYEQVESLFVNLASQVLKADVVSGKSVDELCQVDASAGGAAALPVAQVNYGPNFITILEASPLPASEKSKIKTAAANFLRELFAGLQTVLRNALMIIRAAEHFQLPNFLEVDLDAKHLTPPFFEQDADTVEQVLAKYRLMKMLDWKNSKNTLAFWQDVHDFGDATGNFPLRMVSNGVWKMLCVPLFNESVATLLRQVNELRHTLVGRRGLDHDTAEALLVVKSGLRRLGRDTAQFQPPPEIVND